MAIAGPLRPNPASGGAARSGKTAGLRPAEMEIRSHKLPIRPAPETEAEAPAAMRATFTFARELTQRGFVEGPSEREVAALPAGDQRYGGRRSSARADSLRTDDPRRQIQRQLLLVRERVALPDPMDSLEEMTAHHLLSGRLPLRGILGPDELDALLAAFTAWRAAFQPEKVVWLGGDADGCICLPAKQLLDKYIKSDYSQSAE